MIFLKCSIGGVEYGEVAQDKEKERVVVTASQEVSSQSSPVCNEMAFRVAHLYTIFTLKGQGSLAKNEGILLMCTCM